MHWSSAPRRRIPRDGASLADALKELNIKHRSHGVVFCGCGAVFCSEACLDDDEAHALHCCGPRDEGDPVVAFRGINGHDAVGGRGPAGRRGRVRGGQ